MPAALRPLPSPPPGIGSSGAPSPLWSAAPVPASRELPPDEFPPLKALPDLPFGEPHRIGRAFGQPLPTELSAFPSAPELLDFAKPESMANSLFGPAPVSFEIPTPQFESLASKLSPLASENQPAPVEFSDDDLRDALGPIVEQAVRSAVYAQENGIDTYLEPMLRATIRRALAEFNPTQRPFETPGFIDWARWRLQALFTSRAYEDIVFEKTHRFQVEEVFLLDLASLALISFASTDPGRHASAKRIEGTVQRLALQVRNADGSIRSEFELPESRTAISKSGRFAILIAVVRGRTNELVMADLDFSLRRVEDRFREKFVPGGPPLMQELQPFLEDCLLIQAPANAA